MDEFASRQYPVQEHMVFQRRTWIIQRIGWAVLAAVCLAALTGLLGGGVLSNRALQGAAMTIDYERFERATRLAHFGFRFAPTESTERRLHLSRSFQDKFVITSIQPPPLRSLATLDGLELTFAVALSVENQVTIWARPHDYGSIALEAHADDNPPSNFRVFIYP
jgi:hypothetical protein